MAQKKNKPAAKQPKDMKNKIGLSKVEMAKAVGGGRRGGYGGHRP